MATTRTLRFELALLAAFSACWLLVFAAGVGWLPLAGALKLSLYGLYSVAAALGWVAGNVFVHRGRDDLDARLRKRLLFAYYVGPPSVVFLLRALAPSALQQAAPLVPIYGFGVYSLFFLVPITLRVTRTSRRGLGDR